MQAERQLNVHSVTLVTVTALPACLKTLVGGAHAERPFDAPRALSNFKPVALYRLGAGSFLFVTFEQNDFLVREWNFDTSFIQRFLDCFRYGITNIKPVLTFNEWARDEVHRAIV
jgi:hypothetical protein